MSDINWKDGKVCYAYGVQWNDCGARFSCSEGASFMLGDAEYLISNKDFKLNAIQVGDFIPASELDTEQKYNEVVEVFGLFGFKRFDDASYADTIKAKTDSSCLKVNPSGELICNWHKGNRQLTYSQIIAIGKLKRMMLERERSRGGYIDEIPDNTAEFDAVVSSKSVGMSKYFSDRVGTAKALNIEINGKPAKPKRRNKSKQAYDILKSLGYEYDLVKQRWFKKEYI